VSKQLESYDMTELQDMLDMAKVKIVTTRSAFLSTILFSLEIKWSMDLPTAAVNGIDILINPQFFSRISADERIFLLAHEAWHVAFDHINRGKNFDLEKYNIAADYLINLQLKDENFSVIEGGLIDEKYRDMYTEQIYDLLSNTPKMSKNPSDGEAMGNDIQLPTKEQEGAIQQAVRDIIVRAATQSRLSKDKIGTIPGEVEIYLEELLNPILPWYTILQNYMTTYDKNDFSFRRPNRRYMSQNMYLPIQSSKSMGTIGVGVDTSCSVSDVDFLQFVSEIDDIRQNLNPEKTIIIDFDTKIRKIHELEKDDSISSVQFSGRGGTNMTEMFQWFVDNPPEVLIIFSDLECRQIREKPNFDVIWICNGNPNNTLVNFGELIFINPQ